MAELLLAAALLVTATVLGGLARVLRGPGAADRVMATQLIGSGGVAALLLAGQAAAAPGLADLALILAVLAALAGVALARAGLHRPGGTAPRR